MLNKYQACSITIVMQVMEQAINHIKKTQKIKDLNYTSTEDWNFAASLQLHIFLHPRTCTNWATNSEFPPYLARYSIFSRFPAHSPNTSLSENYSVLSKSTRRVLGPTQLPGSIDTGVLSHC
jgi:hypothetical protein